ncbi:hypothetical protein D3C72_2586750 [compost metagenome]
MLHLWQLALGIFHQIQPHATAACHFAHQQIVQLGALARYLDFYRPQQPLVKAGGKQCFTLLQPA